MMVESLDVVTTDKATVATGVLCRRLPPVAEAGQKRAKTTAGFTIRDDLSWVNDTGICIGESGTKACENLQQGFMMRRDLSWVK